MATDSFSSQLDRLVFERIKAILQRVDPHISATRGADSCGVELRTERGLISVSYGSPDPNGMGLMSVQVTQHPGFVYQRWCAVPWSAGGRTEVLGAGDWIFDLDKHAEKIIAENRQAALQTAYGAFLQEVKAFTAL